MVFLRKKLSNDILINGNNYVSNIIYLKYMINVTQITKLSELEAELVARLNEDESNDRLKNIKDFYDTTNKLIREMTHKQHDSELDGPTIWIFIDFIQKEMVELGIIKSNQIDYSKLREDIMEYINTFFEN